jgi:hypothetical protein
MSRFNVKSKATTPGDGPGNAFDNALGRRSEEKYAYARMKRALEELRVGFGGAASGREGPDIT